MRENYFQDGILMFLQLKTRYSLQYTFKWRYCYILENVIRVSLNNLDTDESQIACYQHDEAPLHNIRPFHNLLYTMFESRWFSNNEHFFWQARSRDLTLIFSIFIWGYVIIRAFALPAITKRNIIEFFRHSIHSQSN